VTLSALELASLLLLPLLAGAGLLRGLGLRLADDPLGAAAWCALAGGLATALVLAACVALGAPLDARLVGPLLATLGLLSAWAGRGRFPAAHAPRRAGHGRLERLFLALVVATLVLATLARILRASQRALALGDEARIWALKALLLLDTGGLNADYAQRSAAYGDSHADYPLLDPLLQLWSLVHARAPLWIEPRFPVQVFALALVLALASALRQWLRPAAAATVLLIAYFVDPNLELTSTANADQMAALGLLVAVDASLRWRRTGEARWARLGALALALLVGAKNEGALLALALVAGHATACLVGRRRTALPSLRALRWLACPLAVFLASRAVNAYLGFENDLATTAAPGILLARAGERLGPLLAFFARLFFQRPRENAGLFGLLLVLSLLVPWRLLRPRLRPLTLCLWAALAGWVLVYLATPHDLRWHLATSAARVTYQALPALCVWLALVAAGDPWFGRHLRARARRGR
jgi:hypothetical protein